MIPTAAPVHEIPEVGAHSLVSRAANGGKVRVFSASIEGQCWHEANFPEFLRGRLHSRWE